MLKNIIQRALAPVWSMSETSVDDLQRYSQEKILQQTRRGVTTMCVVFALLMIAELVLYLAIFDNSEHIYSCVMLAALALHIAFTSRSVDDQKTLHLLGMTLLVIGGTSFLLTAQGAGSFSTTTIVSISLLFMLIPLVPWGLRQGVTIAALIYLTFTLSTWGSNSLFARDTLWVLQFLMLGTMSIALLIVARNAQISKTDIRARFELESANKKISEMS
ncbi:MAG: hypothetical protein HKO71_01780, partial [Pseudomonadales bacterium]|nr:hypothetical protein [Pseudomonadales bacterium]